MYEYMINDECYTQPSLSAGTNAIQSRSGETRFIRNEVIKWLNI